MQAISKQADIKRTWRDGYLSSSQLEIMQIPDPKYLIHGLLPDEGLVLLKGKPKEGKSILAMQFAIAVASESEIFDAQAEKMRVLYLSYEDKERLVKYRMNKQCNGEHFPPLLDWHMSWKAIDDGGAEDLRACLFEQKGIKLVIIDTYGKAIKGRKRDDFSENYQFLGALKNLAHEQKIVILLIHHDRKGASVDDNHLEDALGSQAIVAAADCIISLKREKRNAEGLVFITDKFDGDRKFKVRFNNETLCWKYEGEADEYENVSDKQREIISLLKEKPMRSKEIAKELKKSLRGTQRALSSMKKLIREQNGYYNLIPQDEPIIF